MSNIQWAGVNILIPKGRHGDTNREKWDPKMAKIQKNKYQIM